MVEESTNPELRGGSESVMASPEESGSAPVGPGTKLRGRLARKARGGRRRIIIHAGIHRTGSAAIQDMLFTNRADLLAQGIAYPKAFVANGPDRQHQRSHNGIAGALLRSELTGAGMLEWLSAVVPSSCKTVVLSAQEFCRAKNTNFLADLEGQYDVQAVFYLRRQDHWLKSWYNRNILQPHDRTSSLMTPMEFLDYSRCFHWLNYFELLERWATVIGRDNIHIRALGDGQLLDSARDFAEIIGAEIKVRSVRKNESVSADKVELARRLNLFSLDRRVRKKIVSSLLAVPSSGSKEIYSASVRRLLFQNFHGQNQLVARHYLSRANGRLFFDDRFPESDPPLEWGLHINEALAFRLIDALLAGVE